MTRKRMEISCNKPKADAIHSPSGVEDLRNEAKDALTRKYYGLAMSMFEYDFSEEAFSDMKLMSRDTMPEKYLLDNGEACFFEVNGKVHCLPAVYEEGLNMYGYASTWRAVPVGWDDSKRSLMPVSWTQIYDKVRSYDDSVLIRNSLYSGTDKAFIDKMVDMLVDNLLTTNQLQILVRSPIVFNVTEDNVLSAKNYYLSLSECKPVIFTNKMGEELNPVIPLKATVDPAVFEIFDRVECQILEYLGFPCVPITKRAQQSVSEVDSSTDKIYVRRQERFRQREAAIERLNDLFGTHAKVVSVIDEVNEQMLAEQEESDESVDDTDGGD